MSDAFARLQGLLRQLFQFESKELDFGIYRIMNHKRGAVDLEDLKAGIFNHVHTFFSRYYDDGDFLSKRRYSRRQKYAVPYNGEEVYLHWANADQYYVKTGEHFADYRYRSG